MILLFLLLLSPLFLLFLLLLLLLFFWRSRNWKSFLLPPLWTFSLISVTIPFTILSHVPGNTGLLLSSVIRQRTFLSFLFFFLSAGFLLVSASFPALFTRKVIELHFDKYIVIKDSQRGLGVWIFKINVILMSQKVNDSKTCSSSRYDSARLRSQRDPAVCGGPF